MTETYVKNLKLVTKEEQEEFIKSFDTVLFDCDGVLWKVGGEIFEATGKVLTKLENIQKKIHFVTDNCVQPMQEFADILTNNGFKANKEMFTNPVVSVIKYLKSINFEKKILAITTRSFRHELQNAGFDVVLPPTGPFAVHTKNPFDSFKTLDADIGAVIIDVNYDITLANINECIKLLQDPGILFLAGTTFKLYPMKNYSLLGPGFVQELISVGTNRQPMKFGKPSDKLCEVIFKYCDIEDPGRVLFVGDSINHDMSFAHLCGFQKLLLLSGVTPLQSLSSCPNVDLLPDYYLDRLQDLLPILNNVNLL